MIERVSPWNTQSKTEECFSEYPCFERESSKLWNTQSKTEECFSEAMGKLAYDKLKQALIIGLVVVAILSLGVIVVAIASSGGYSYLLHCFRS